MDFKIDRNQDYMKFQFSIKYSMIGRYIYLTCLEYNSFPFQHEMLQKQE